MRLVRAHRFDPKQIFRCLRCDLPSKKLRVARRYLFVIEDGEGRSSDFCLPCAATLLSLRQGAIRQMAEASTAS